MATPARAEQVYARRMTVADRLLAAAPLIAAYLLLALVYAWQAVSHGSPWLFSDEAEYTQLSRAIAETGSPAERGIPHDAVSLYTYLLAPVWFINDTETAYATAKYLGVFVMTSALFPAYGLARLVAPRGPALFAAVATASVPVIGYSRLLVTEVLAYPFAALAFFVIAKAMSTRNRYWAAAALLVLLVAPHVRKQFFLFYAIAAIAAAIAVWLSPTARRFRRDWGVVQWAAAAVGLAVVVRVAHHQLIRHSDMYYVATTLPDRMRDFSVWATGAFVIGVGILPAIVALASLWRPRDTDEPGYRVVVGLFVGATVLFGLYTVVKAVHLSTVYGNVVAERNLIFLTPLVFALTAFFVHRPGGHPLALAGAATLVALLVTRVPFNLDHYPYFDAPGLGVLALFNRDLYLDDPTIERMLVWIVVGSLLLTAAAVLARERMLAAARAALAVAAVAVVGWTLAGEFSFGNGINDLANRLRGSLPDPPTWVDNITRGGETMYVGQGIGDLNPVLLAEFWNRSVRHVASLDGSAPGPGPTPVLVPYTRDGRVVNDPGVDYIVTNTPGVDPVGELVYSPGGWRLYRIHGPIRLRSSFTGLYSDGWSGSAATYNRFGSGERGVVEITVSRKLAPETGKVTIRVGSLVPAPIETIANPCKGDVCADYNPKIDRLLARTTWTARAGEERTFRFSVTTPFRVEVTVDPPFRPLDFGGTDLRYLGAQLGFAFKRG